tara:strand:- start:1429 stop:1599 length:171 start_codon:yes stop_codon:yes gene_type:complete
MKTININEIIKQVIEENNYNALDIDNLIKDCIIKVVEVLVDVENFKVKEDIITINE